MKIKLTQLAAQDLQSTIEYISQDSPTAAESTVNRIIDSIENLAAFPGMGRSGRVSNTKELVVSGTPFIIIYQIRNDTLFIARIIHASRKWP